MGNTCALHLTYPSLITSPLWLSSFPSYCLWLRGHPWPLQEHGRGEGTCWTTAAWLYVQ